MGFTPGGGGGIGNASDVAISLPSNNQVLTYDTSVAKWKNATISGSGSVMSTDITDATATGRSILTAANGNAVKTAAGITNVDNTSDSSKPISTATQTALNNKVTQAGSGSLRIWPASTTFPSTGVQVGDLFPHIEEA